MSRTKAEHTKGLQDEKILRITRKHKTTDRYRGCNNYHHGSGACVVMVVKSIKILPCDKCRGRGVRSESKVTNYHQNESFSWLESCPDCDGSGRMEEETTVTLKPYVQPAKLGKEYGS